MKTRVLVIGTLLVFLVATGATWVMAQSGETVLACAAKDGTLRIIADRDECKKKETIYEWYAYTVVDALLGDEAAARLAADAALQGNIDAEAAARLAADETLQGNIDAEAAARLAADADLQSQIDTMVKADPPCFDNANRYVDCGNGTVHDTVTNLIWLKNAGCYGRLTYAAANNAAAGLEHGECGLTDGSSPGDWRLATLAEWEATIAKADEMLCWNPILTDTKGTGCYKDGSQPFTGVQSHSPPPPNLPVAYWSSTTLAGDTDGAWVVALYNGYVFNGSKASTYFVWPVRGGP